MWQRLLLPATFTPTVATIHPMMPMMPTMPYQAIKHMGHQVGPPTPAVVPPAPAPAPPAGMMMHYYAPYQQPPPFCRLGANNGTNKIYADVNFTLPCPIPTHNYALATLILPKTISTDANTIKQWAILNSGATSHFLTTNAPATNILPTTMLIIARPLNGKRVHSMHMCTLNIPLLSLGARSAHIIPGLASHLLLYVVTMSNEGCTVTFMKIGCTIMYRSKTIVCRHKCQWVGLWMVPLTPDMSTNPTSTPTIRPSAIAVAANVDATSSATKYAQYVHQLLCSPLAATLLLALDKSTKLQTIPGLTPALICSHLPRSTTTNKSRMRCHSSNTASTCNKHADVILAQVEVDCMFSAHKACAAQDMLCFATLADATSGTMYTDLIGAFPVRLFKNMQYIFVAYIYDLNAIIFRPMPSRTDASFIAAFTKVFKILRPWDYQPVLNVMDNECSQAVAKHIQANKMTIQLVPLHNHRVNAAK
jgi:hypothetical protein